jgi:hypothetical protein
VLLLRSLVKVTGLLMRVPVLSYMHPVDCPVSSVSYSITVATGYCTSGAELDSGSR